jgi:hypothetical protein
VDVASLRGFNDDQYNKLKGAVQAKKTELDNAEAQRQEQQRLADEQRQREQDLLKQQQDDLKKQQDQLREQQEQLKRDQQAAAQIKLDNRINQLLALGMVKRHTTLEFDNGFKEFSTLISDVAELPEEKWATFLQDHKEGIAERNRLRDEHQEQQKKEKEEVDRREKFIAESLNTVGMIYDYGRKLFHWTSKELDPITATWNDFAGLDDAAIATKAHQLGDMITAAKQEETKILNERDKETKKQEKLALGDKDRYQQEHRAIAEAATKMVPGEFKTKKYQQRSQQFLEQLTQLLKTFE